MRRHCAAPFFVQARRSLPHREPTETLKDFWKSLTLLTKGNEAEGTVHTPGQPPGQTPKERKKRR